MPTIGLFSRTALPALRRLMDLSAARQRVSAENLANVNTPGYSRREARFADELNRAEGATIDPVETRPGHRASGAPEAPSIEVVEDPETLGEGVDMEKEMVSLAETQLRFAVSARLATLKIAGLRNSIRGQV
ncbi:MAG: flagellar basal body rod protein FlgB [Candidatus Eisenbacteria bacterium]|nr:flagellar basal body rod protein FlgB [Candidatus Eisenbacteria bacterium]